MPRRPEAVARPTMPFVPIMTETSSDLKSLPGARALGDAGARQSSTRFVACPTRTWHHSAERTCHVGAALPGILEDADAKNYRAPCACCLGQLKLELDSLGSAIDEAMR